jgi:hypothetical protein
MEIVRSSPRVRMWILAILAILTTTAIVVGITQVLLP